MTVDKSTSPPDVVGEAPDSRPASSHFMEAQGVSKSFHGREVLAHVNFTLDSGEIAVPPAFIDHVHQGLIPASATHSLGVHPTQLYEAAVLLLIFVLLAVAYRYRRFPGQCIAFYLMLYPAARFGLEYVRGDAMPRVGSLSDGWYFSDGDFSSGFAGGLDTLMSNLVFTPSGSTAETSIPLM